MSIPPARSTPRPYATMRDVARLAGVGLKTVSRVINSEPNVSADTVAKVLDAAARLDYRPDLHAGNLKRAGRKTRTIGLVVGSVANPFSAALNRGVEDVAAEHGTAVFASSLDDDADREERIIGEMIQRRVDALILTTVGRDQTHLAREQERGTVLVFVDRLPTGIAADAVVTNNQAAASRGVQHLVAHGHRPDRIPWRPRPALDGRATTHRIRAGSRCGGSVTDRCRAKPARRKQCARGCP